MSIVLRKKVVKEDIYTHSLYFGNGDSDYLDVYTNKGWFIVDGNVEKGENVFQFDSESIPDKIDVDIQKRNSLIAPFVLSSIRRNGDKIEFCYYASAGRLIEDASNNWAPLAFYKAVMEEIKDDRRFSFENSYIDEWRNVYDSSVYVTLQLRLGGKVEALYCQGNDIIIELIKRLDNRNRLFEWNDEYLRNEQLFSIQVIQPLLRKMRFNSVRFNHGRKEYGKDFTFCELDKFGQVKYFGMQVKAGNVSGKVNSSIDELIGQIEDAFTIPYYDLDSRNPLYISTLIILISGHFTENAKEKIMYKVNKGLHGSVYFIDQEKVLELIEKYWN